ncbi:hypothetical protein FGL91_10670 [Microbacterium sp. CBA3102]|uniref:hypothetical protein n=1 Tax=Microbacterium sp. CBA3102 TaxID=2603598 RepID=UPI0011BB5BC0|nr:hypothetical protein [Microbacterium sp. CBA3102]QEA28980.1 hypothetical protein FGL91_10670 [Microbacterium sp. CBA3102]
MLQNSFGVHISSASVDRGDGSDPRSLAHDILAGLRVPAGVREAEDEWDDHSAALLAIPVTDDGHVLTLSEEDRIASTLSVADLREAFRSQGLTLWLEDGTDPDDDGIDAEDPEDPEDVGDEEDEDDLEDEELDSDTSTFTLPTVQVCAFSHRGPAVARLLSSIRRMVVDHQESGEWSLQQFETSEPTGDWTTSRAELPVIELNRVDSDAWIEVTPPKGGPIPFWIDAERGTRPVLDIEAIRIPETAEICRRLLAEGDGSRDELLELAAMVRLDVDAAHRALMPESLGGVVGTEARQRAFLAAFGIAPDLIDAAFGGQGACPNRRFLPLGPWATVRETAIAGVGEFTALTRRDRPLARLGDAIRRRPVVGIALALAEFSAGMWLTSRTRGGGRSFGVLLVVDALIDLAIWITRIRRGRQG